MIFKKNKKKIGLPKKKLIKKRLLMKINKSSIDKRLSAKSMNVRKTKRKIN
jgi:hypothetical protein